MSFAHHGKRFRRSTETEDKKLAGRIFDKLKGEIAEGTWFTPEPGEGWTFKDLADKYMTEYSAVNKAASTHKRDKSLFKNLLGTFGDYGLTEITSAMISDYKVKRRREGASARTSNYELTVMSHAFNMAMREWELAKDNPVKRVRKDRENNRIERWLSLAEERRLLDASPRWLQDIIVFAINTGMRQSEILDLKWGQVDRDRRTLTIFEQKNRCVDTLPLNYTVMQLLEARWRDDAEPGDYVFPNTRDERKGNILLLKAFHTALRKSGVQNFRFHDLRHTFATRLVQAGVDLYSVQKLGRWKTTSMVQRYAHHHTETLRNAIEVMDGIGDGRQISHKSVTVTKNKGYKPPYLQLVTL